MDNQNARMPEEGSGDKKADKKAAKQAKREEKARKREEKLRSTTRPHSARAKSRT